MASHKSFEGSKDMAPYAHGDRETPGEHLERLLVEADLDVAEGRVSDARADLAEIRKACGL